MKNQSVLFRFLVLFLLCFAGKTYAQPPYSFTGPVAVFTYDNVGNRVKREIKTICVGVGCPPVSSDGPTGRPGNPTDSGSKSSAGVMLDAYPNPTEEDLYVANRNWHENDKATVVVYDVNSKIAIREDFTRAKDKISFRRLTPGVYMVQYYLNGVPVQLWKIIKP